MKYSSICLVRQLLSRAAELEFINSLEKISLSPYKSV